MAALVSAVSVAIVALQVILALPGIELAATDRADLETHEVEFGRKEGAE